MFLKDSPNRGQFLSPERAVGTQERCYEERPFAFCSEWDCAHLTSQPEEPEACLSVILGGASWFLPQLQRPATSLSALWASLSVVWGWGTSVLPLSSMGSHFDLWPEIQRHVCIVTMLSLSQRRDEQMRVWSNSFRITCLGLWLTSSSEVCFLSNDTSKKWHTKCVP